MCTNAGYLVASRGNATQRGTPMEELAFIYTSKETDSELIVFEAEPGMAGYVSKRRIEQKNIGQSKNSTAPQKQGALCQFHLS